MNDNQNNNINPQLNILNNLNVTPVGNQYSNQNSSVPNEINNNQNQYVKNQNPNNTYLNNLNNNNNLGTTSNITYADTVGNVTNNIAPTNQTTEPAQNNQFINTNPSPNNTYINDLNVDGSYNRIEKMEPPSYVNDPQVRENMDSNKKNTVTITKELKTVIIMALVMLVFIFIMPVIFDLIRNIRFN